MKKLSLLFAFAIVTSASVWAQASHPVKRPVAAKPEAPAPAASPTFRPGTVTGSFTVNGKKAIFKYVYAFLQQGSFDSARENVYVILSDAPVTEAMLAEEFGLSKEAGDGKLHAIRVEFNEKMQPGMGHLYHDGFKEMSAMSSQGTHDFAPSSYDGKSLAGKLSAKPQKSDEDRWEYSATFSAPINPKPKSMAKQ